MSPRCNDELPNGITLNKCALRTKIAIAFIFVTLTLVCLCGVFIFFVNEKERNVNEWFQSDDLEVFTPSLSIVREYQQIVESDGEVKILLEKSRSESGQNDKGDGDRLKKRQLHMEPTSRLPNGEDADPVARERRNKVREMTLHAWNNYKQYAWGKNELKPLSMRPHAGIFGAYDLGATIVDGLDTLYIMGLDHEYRTGRDWIAKNFTFQNKNADLSVFETTIRFVGGLLTLYSFTGDEIYKEKAKEVADKLLPAFRTPTGIPKPIVNTLSGYTRTYGWTVGRSSILSELGTLHLEFSYLTDITGDPVYHEYVRNIRQILKEATKPNGLYPNYISPYTRQWGQNHVSLGALGDSFYEYLLKVWIQSGKTDSDSRKMYDDAMEAVANNLIQRSPNGLIYAADMKYGMLEHKMGHLACFAGGLFALGAATKRDKNSERFMEIGKGITNTCHESYIRSYTRLGPEEFRFNEWTEAKAIPGQPNYYILRPETVESYFILWRLTKDQKYREWGWDVIQAIEKYCRSPGGYSGINNVYFENPQKDDVQQSFYIAEVLKYLYLLYSDDSLLPLDQWVFNTEAHPIPVKGNPMYRQASSQINKF